MLPPIAVEAVLLYLGGRYQAPRPTLGPAE